jgi:hypothetical protein
LSIDPEVRLKAGLILKEEGQDYVKYDIQKKVNNL